MRIILLFLLSTLYAINCALADPLGKPATTEMEHATTAPEQHDAIYVSDTLKLAPKSQHDENKSMRYTIDANYPQIEGENLTPGALQFNTLVNAMIKEELDRFKRYVISDMPHMKNLPDGVKHNSLNIDYDTDVIKPGNDAIVSVRLSIEGMQAGRAHPYHNNRVLNFDLVNNKSLKLSDIFKPKASYLKLVSAYTKKKLDEKLSDKWMIADGTKPIEKNFKNWNLESDGILFTFDEYQVAPYVDGIQEVSVPYSELKNIISPNAPIVPCIAEPKTCVVQVFVPSTEIAPTEIPEQ